MTYPPARALEGVRVLELAHLIAGPTCGMYLADMGADVIKVESRESPDASRTVYGIARAGEGILHLTVNRNKRALCLDGKGGSVPPALPRALVKLRLEPCQRLRHWRVAAAAQFDHGVVVKLAQSRQIGALQRTQDDIFTL